MKGKKAYILFIYSILGFGSGLQAQDIYPEPLLPEKHVTTEAQPRENIMEDYLKGYYSQIFGVEMTGIFNTSLYATIEQWLGTPYRYAGKTFKGIDCSAFVNKIYENAYCFFIKGNSLEMYRNSKHVTKDELAEGDLVFFNTNRNKIISHVGVYLGNNKFAHASRTRGVIVSDLTHSYYKRYFVNGGRIEFQNN